jgi:UDP-N-acetyl-2-amino-2-deoxyglucuronate dehydrogenase
LDKLNRELKQPLDYLSICTPNYLHDSHIRMALRCGAHAICEKPLVLNPWNLDALQKIEKESDKQVNTILQLRLHPSIIALKEKIEKAPKDKIFEVDLTYLTSRGSWYYASWKGDIQKSGGIASNIGVHFFDMLTWVFGGVKENIVHLHEHDRASGYMELENARVRWFLSINEETLPDEIRAKGQRTYRSITVDGEEIEFSNGFFDLHTTSYEHILKGSGFGLEDARTSVEIVHEIRNKVVTIGGSQRHPFVDLPKSKHPFYK